MYKNSSAHKQARSIIETRFAGETPQQIADHIEIAAKYARRKRPNHFIARLRIVELVRLFQDRYRSDQLPNDDAGRPDLRLLLDHAAQIGPKIARQWAMKLMPSLNDDDSLDNLLKEVGPGRRWDADDLARAVGLEDARRARLRIKTIGATDCGKAQRLTRRKRKRNADDRARRLKAGAKPHAQSVERAAPWIEAGISRRTYYNRKKRAISGTCIDCTGSRPILSTSSIGLEVVQVAREVPEIDPAVSASKKENLVSFEGQTRKSISATTRAAPCKASSLRPVTVSCLQNPTIHRVAALESVPGGKEKAARAAFFARRRKWDERQIARQWRVAGRIVKGVAEAVIADQRQRRLDREDAEWRAREAKLARISEMNERHYRRRAAGTIAATPEGW